MQATMKAVRLTAIGRPLEMQEIARPAVGPQDVLAELARREGVSGLDEKAGRNG